MCKPRPSGEDSHGEQPSGTFFFQCNLAATPLPFRIPDDLLQGILQSQRRCFDSISSQDDKGWLGSQHFFTRVE